MEGRISRDQTYVNAEPNDQELAELEMELREADLSEEIPVENSLKQYLRELGKYPL